MAPSHPAKHARVYVVRHADAGVRGHGPDDRLRPLSSSGQAQAVRLVHLLDLTSAGQVVSSPYVRCVQTVQPLATRHRKPVVFNASLAEGAPVEETWRLLRQLPDGSVACTHGDVLEALTAVVDTLGRGVHQISFDKGGVWVLSRQGKVLSLVEQRCAKRAPSVHRKAALDAGRRIER